MKISYLLLGGSILYGCSANEKEMTAPSNIILILSDDQSFRAMSHFDGEVKTPNLEGLARNGTIFTHAYNMGSWRRAVCMPSRAMLITGSFVWDAYRFEEEYRNQDEPLSRPMWGNLMQQAGYETYFPANRICRKGKPAGVLCYCNPHG